MTENVPKFICKTCGVEELCVDENGKVICPGTASRKIYMRHAETGCPGNITYVGRRGIYKARRIE